MFTAGNTTYDPVKKIIIVLYLHYKKLLNRFFNYEKQKKWGYINFNILTIPISINQLLRNITYKMIIFKKHE
jgi:hypothetical protein